MDVAMKVDKFKLTNQKGTPKGQISLSGIVSTNFLSTVEMSALYYDEVERPYVVDVSCASALPLVPIPVLVRDEYDEDGRLLARELSRYQ